MTHTVGTLVKARGREWVVQAIEDGGLLLLKPVGGADNEPVGILPDLDPVETAQFGWPSPDDIGDFQSARLLRDAIRLGFRNSAGPFRSFGTLGFEPRNYQLVPLLMSLKLDPIRLLIGDDVGIGKTVEAGMVAVEALATGLADKLTVLCPPHLAEQWAGELSSKFHLEPTLVLSSTAPKLERGLGHGESLFDRHRVTVVSTDFIKTARRRDEFVRAAPGFVIVDEAHTVSADQTSRRSTRHQRFELVRRLADDPDRHLLLVTATPHTGNEGAFRSLLGLLDDRLRRLEGDNPYTGDIPDVIERHFIQRKRPDIRVFLDETTVFPDRYELDEADTIYTPTGEYQRFISHVTDWARGRLGQHGLSDQRDRMRYWAVLGLLRQVASSPAAAAATLRNRAAFASTDTADETDEVARRTLLDAEGVEDESVPDVIVGTRTEDAEQAQLLALAEEADTLHGPDADAKLDHTTKLVSKLVSDGYNPIVFCRFIETAEYVAAHLDGVLPNPVRVEAVTGRVPSDQREATVASMKDADKRVLVATDCLSEGINLQSLFSAVVHYDLPWNPTRLEQREGRVDRYGQTAKTVRVATVFSPDTIIDQLVMDVLIRKHRTIKTNLGVSIPVPGSTDEFLESAAGALMNKMAHQQQMFDGNDELDDVKRELFTRWDNATAKEKESRTRYAQRTVKTDEIERELKAVRDAIGKGVDVADFVYAAVTRLGGTVRPGGMAGEPPALLSLARLPSALRDTLRHDLDLDSLPDHLEVRYEPPSQPDERLLTRTSPFVATLASYIADAALDIHIDAPVSRAGVITTDTVETATVLLLLRHRYDLTSTRHDERTTRLVEEITLAGYRPDPTGGDVHWLDRDETEQLLAGVTPTGNLDPDAKRDFFAFATDRDTWKGLDGLLDRHVQDAADDTLATHRRVREQAGGGLGRTDISPHLPPDVIGAFVLMPA